MNPYVYIVKLKWPEVTITRVTGMSYESIEWNTAAGVPIPTKAELDAAIAELTLVNNNASILAGAVIATYYGATPEIAGTTTLAASNMLPLVTDGTQIWADVITPQLASSKFIIAQSLMVDASSNNRNISFVLFRNDIPIWATAVNIASTGRIALADIYCVDEPATLSPVTYSLRVGANGSTTWRVSSSNSGMSFGGINKGYRTIMEIK